MAGVTPLGLRYPTQGDLVTSQSWADLASDVDGALTNLNTYRTAAMRRPTASISGTVGPATASGVDGLMTFTTVNWDTSGLANLGVNNERLTLPAGVWWGSVYSLNLTGFATFTYARVGMITIPGPFLWSHMMLDTVGTASGGGFQVIASGVIVTTDPATALQMRIRWLGTGGPATWGAAQMQVYKIRDIADL